MNCQFRRLAVRSAGACAQLHLHSGVEELRGERTALDLQMPGDFPEDARQRADAEARMIGDRHVMLASLSCRETQVTPTSRVTW
jgi:hypothetical protein